jgi:hypothetical protein
MSIIDKRKPSFSPKHSIKEHHDEKTDDNNREKKNDINEIPIEEVFKRSLSIVSHYQSSRKT